MLSLLLLRELLTSLLRPGDRKKKKPRVRKVKARKMKKLKRQLLPKRKMVRKRRWK
jgi:hypothetical protein